MKCQALICSYPKDFGWLDYCLQSLNRFSEGFLPPVVCVEAIDAPLAGKVCDMACPAAVLKVRDGRPGQGFMRAQIAMMRADELCPDADVIFFIGSDCVAVEKFTPGPYLAPDGRPAVLFSKYEIMKDCHADTLPWRPGVRRVLGFEPPAEYMRRLPSVFPRSIFAPMRKHVETLHGRGFDDYIYTADAVHHNTSEANILGAFAHRHMPETCEWVDVATQGLYGCQVIGWPTVILQLWSHGGLDRPTDSRFELNGKSVVGRLPRDIIKEVLGAK